MAKSVNEMIASVTAMGDDSPHLFVCDRAKLELLLVNLVLNQSTGNPPLTFEQLKQRVGKPVYRKVRGGKGMWMILVSTKESISQSVVIQTVSLAGIYPLVVAFDKDEYYDHELCE